jgi:hypothetical protein
MYRKLLLTLTLISAALAGNLRAYDLGIFERGAGKLSADPAFKLEMKFLDMGDFKPGDVKKLIAAETAKHRTLVLSIEPRDLTLEKITSGGYDPLIKKIFAEIGKTPVYIRFAHEMETPHTDYSWSGQDPKTYIDAYNHFVSVARKVAPNTKFIWCPEGEENAGDFYPGSDTVDIIGLEIYSYAQYDISAYGKPLSFKDTMDERYGRVATIDMTKPVMICELAAFSVMDPNYTMNWITDALNSVSNYPRMQAVILFSGRDPVPWGTCPPPNFTLSSVPVVTASASPTPTPDAAPVETN